MKIYVCHHLPLKERHGPMIEQLDKYNYKYEFMTHHPTGSELDIFGPNLHSSECSLAVKHLECFKQIAESDEDYSLILEDDAIFSDDFNTKLDSYLSQLPDDFDMFFISNGCGTHIAYNKKNNIYNRLVNGKGCTRCTDAYFASKSGAKKINQYLIDNPQIDRAVDHWLNLVGKELNLRVYWGEPTIVHQGSETSQYRSSLNGKRHKSDRR